MSIHKHPHPNALYISTIADLVPCLSKITLSTIISVQYGTLLRKYWALLPRIIIVAIGMLCLSLHVGVYSKLFIERCIVISTAESQRYIF